jgi:hypothetical protein
MTRKEIVSRLYSGLSGFTIIYSKKYGYEISDINPLYNDMTGINYKRVPLCNFTLRMANDFIFDLRYGTDRFYRY